MKRRKLSLMSVAVGAGLMFLLDPDKGKRRRAYPVPIRALQAQDKR